MEGVVVGAIALHTIIWWLIGICALISWFVLVIEVVSISKSLGLEGKLLDAIYRIELQIAQAKSLNQDITELELLKENYNIELSKIKTKNKETKDAMITLAVLCSLVIVVIMIVIIV